MRKSLFRIAALLGCLALAAGGYAQKPPDTPGGGGDDGGDGQEITPAVITFRDCNDGFSSSMDFLNLHGGDDPCATNDDLVDDRIQSDNHTSYIHGEESVEAFIGSKAKKGNVLLRLGDSSRALFLDFTDCASPPEECNPPFDTKDVNDANLEVDANDVKKDGLFGMAVGESISAPMRILFTLPDFENPFFLDFNPKLAGSNPCKDKSNRITVERTATDTWEIIGDPIIIGCVSTSDGSFLGTYTMPFQFTVQPQ